MSVLMTVEMGGNIRDCESDKDSLLWCLDSAVIYMQS